jgi:outer membrane lipoprotein SlyB
MLFVWIRSVAMTKRIFHAAAILPLILTAVSVSAGEVDATTVLGGALGGGVGAAIGSAVGGGKALSLVAA